MKTTFKQFNFLFFILFVIVITGCGKDDEKEEIPMISISDSEYHEYQKYIDKNLYDVESLGYKVKEANPLVLTRITTNITNVDFSGLKNNHLYLRSVQFDTLYRNDYSKWKTVIEWEDTEITTKEQKMYLGYGDYKNFTIDHVEPRFLSTNGMNFTANLMLSYSNAGVSVLIFKHQESIKRIATNYLDVINWYQGSLLTRSSQSLTDNLCCYSAKGDTIYTSSTSKSLPDANAIPVSYEESISVDNYFVHNYDLTITKYNWKEGKQVWSVKVVSPYNEPSNSKYTSTLLDKSTNIWKYKVDIVYYDGTKKDFMFTVNVNDGKVINL